MQACWDTGMRQPGVVFVDGPDHEQYDSIKLPPNWLLVKWVDIGGCGNLAGSKRYIMEKYPQEKVYGWLADDNVPETMNWCQTVEEIAHPWHLVHCRDYFVSDFPNGVRILQETRNLGGGICWGGELVRCVGWWAPPGVVQGSIDWAWTSLVLGTTIGVYKHDIIVRHDNWRTGRRTQDENDDLTKPFIVKDVNHIAKYRESPEFLAIRERVIREYKQYKSRQA